MSHHLLILDFESYYASDYSLKKLTPPEYILGPKFEVIMCSVKVDGGPAKFVDGPDFGNWIAQYDPAECTTVTFNALFDNCILAWHYGFVPSRMFCAMRMAAAMDGHKLASVSLASVCRHLHLKEKGRTIESVMGMRRADIMAQPRLWEEFKGYCLDDSDRCQEIFDHYYPMFPTAERKIMDRVLRCAVQPKFQVDTEMLSQHLADLEVERIEMLHEAGMPPFDMIEESEKIEAHIEAFAKTLRSNPKFEKILESYGVDIEYKDSGTAVDEQGKAKQIPAFAKTDEFMEKLQEHENPVVQALACARLGLRSTIEVSRGQRILDLASLPWACYRDGSPRMYTGGTLPIPLKYSAAHTHRLGGDWSINMQNLPSGRGKKKSKLRKSLVAPPGHSVVVADLAQIECRINAWLCGEQALLDVFAAGGDPYAELAIRIFEIINFNKTTHALERFIGKSGELGLGFGCGHVKFYNMVVRSARLLGMDMKQLFAVWTPELAEKSVSQYRTLRWRVKATWDALKIILETAWLGVTAPVKFGPCVIGHGYVEGPGGLKMQYADPRWDETGNSLLYTYGKRVHRMYAPKFLENIVQFLARIVVMNASLRISDRTGIHFSLQAHDELVWIVPDAAVALFKTIVMAEMCRRPSWAQDIPLNAECNHGPSYGDAK